MNCSTANRIATFLVAAILLRVTVTAYHAPCRRCHTKRHTVTGANAHGSGLAVDPRLIPIGSRVKLGGKWYVADDIGPHGHRVDIRLPNTANVHKRMKAFGRKRMTIRVIRKR